MKLNERLAALRKKKGLSQLELAEALDVSRQAVSKWENGRSAPSTENLLQLSGIYGIPLDALVNCDLPIPDLEPEAEPKKKWWAYRIMDSWWFRALVFIGFMSTMVKWGMRINQGETVSKFIYPKAAEALIQEFDSGQLDGMEVSTAFAPSLITMNGQVYHPDFPDRAAGYCADRKKQCGFELLLEAAYPEPTIVSVSSETKGGEARLIVARGQEAVEEIFVDGLPQELLLEPGEYRFFLAADHYTGKLNLDMDWPSLPVWITPPGIEREKTPEELARFEP